ncbi:DUF3307 domain-containing protein [Kitasatospora sp. NPDC087861]|uniref:DUF3307 domain-containing protein n=1 Tax=Kitasatospora sp. NPDC087861 TaxID=3364070 RepID=UPI0038103298
MFADTFVLLFVAHYLSDFPLQTDRLATRKAGWTEGEEDPHPGRHHHGWGANLVHAGTHVATTAALLAIGVLALGLDVRLPAAAAALAWVGLSHSLIDRRIGVRWWMEHTGQSGYLETGGAAQVDQAAHIGLGLFPAALLLTVLS